MSFVVDTNFIITLSEIGQISSLTNLKEKVILPKSVKDEVDRFRIDLEPVKSNISIFGVTDAQVENFVTELAKNLKENTITFILELKDNYENIHVPDKWSHIPNTILRSSTPREFTNVISNNQNIGMIIEKDAQNRILGQADIHVCAVVTNNPDNFVMTMDASIWIALYHINNNFQNNIYPIFSSLRLLFKDNPLKFIDALTQVIAKKRYKFVKNVVDSVAARICYEDLLSSIDDVLQRTLSDLINENNWASQKDNYIELISLRERLRNVVEKNTTHNGELSFSEEQFINDLKDIHTLLSANMQKRGGK